MALTDDVVALTKTTDVKANYYLEQAKSIILGKIYWWKWADDETHELPKRYENLAVRMAVYLVNKEGAEGEQSHSEGGISRTYESGSVPKSMLEEIAPMVRVL